jgi:sugar-specific transcriptional regulator TrmB
MNNKSRRPTVPADPECAQLISQLGFTELEAEIYVYLLQDSPATGYKVAKEIGRSFTNTYKALASLQAKGAILVDEGASRLSRAVPVEELLDQLERRFRTTRKKVTEAVERLPRAAVDTRIYQLTSLEQVYERCRRLLAECQERALIELFPEPLAVLREPVEAAAARGVDITVRVYEPASLSGVRTFLSPFGPGNIGERGAQWLALFVDGKQVLLGLLAAGGGVYQAIWTANPVLSWALFDYVNSDFHHYAFRSHLDAATSLEELRFVYANLQDAFPIGRELGYQDLFAAFAASDAAPDQRGTDGHVTDASEAAGEGG